LFFALHCADNIAPAELFAEHTRWAARHATLLAPTLPHQNDRDPNRRIRVGLVSRDFHQHPVAYFLLPLLRHHDKDRLELICYSDTSSADAITSQIQTLVSDWHEISDQSHDNVAELIRSHRIDVLIDLAGHTGRNRLPVFARKPAPVQITWLGYPNTTGMSQMDYRITDAIADPPGESDRLHAEKLIRLPTCAWCYEPPADAPAMATKQGAVRFASFNNFAKVSAATVKLWSRVLAAVPDSTLGLKSTGLDEPATQQEIRSRFAAHGTAPQRIQFLGFTRNFSQHLSAYNATDIALDPFPYNGTTTTCEAMWMGNPVVTLRGRSHVSCVGASLLNAAGFAEWVADSEDGYVEICRSLARNGGPGREQIREKLRESALMDGRRFAREFEESIRTCWKSWCVAPDAKRG
jgi:predicted O-linked N-acetylglucosamine transferase (SPINDLY family)